MGIFPLCYTKNGSDVSGLAKWDSLEFQYGVEANVAMFLLSPAQGAMFAPLVLKSV
jgi:hypothetical protein